jgi:hypothetical protein
VIVQIDSLHRLESGKYPELLVLDEIESILSKMPSCAKAGQVYQSFILLLKNSGKIIMMDGLMEPRTIEYLTIIAGRHDEPLPYVL